ncbi:hypothetical protein PENSPDRAFT_83012 [Peniophora sp. CONT]|nr:hypothetical protein PENSPDRAFT_83012 [Peniophora sp. CONT]
MSQALDIAKIVPEPNYIQRISPEQLLVVFEACKHLDTAIPAWWYDPSSPKPRRPCPTMLVVSQVCRSWRALTHSTSTLWSEVLLDNVK